MADTSGIAWQTSYRAFCSCVDRTPVVSRDGTKNAFFIFTKTKRIEINAFFAEFQLRESFREKFSFTLKFSRKVCVFAKTKGL
jgi:hypothetical protein